MRSRNTDPFGWHKRGASDTGRGEKQACEFRCPRQVLACPGMRLCFESFTAERPAG